MRPFKFGMQAARVLDPDQWVELARCAEDTGYSAFQIPDHLGRLATFPALMAAAAATRHITLTTYVLNQDFRPPAILAQEAASVQLLTGDRLELGIGAGWAKHDYTQTGLQYDSAAVRVARFDEYVQVVKGLLNASEPFSFQGRFFHIERFQPLPRRGKAPPILIGGGSPRILAIAGRLADVVSVSTRATPDGRVDMPNVTLAALEEKLRFIQPAAGGRYDQIELNMTLRDVRITDDRRAAARELLEEWRRMAMLANADQLTEDDLLESPYVALGTVDQIVEQCEMARERWGFSYFEVSSTDAEAIAPVMKRLAGR
jgi:probable F420-dependent oxidoreductase